MKLIAEKYRKLRPTLEHLSDSVVMAQAWKKSHAYIRNRNWYADTLALDVSALGLEDNAHSWANDVADSTKRPYSLELIPAAKSEKWVIDEKKGWTAQALLDKKHEKLRQMSPPLRPLAHITIRDQTWATAAMLCLADAVETAQGDCSIRSPIIARDRKVYSYGNRLLCDWRPGNRGADAWFRWGNGETYRKFFSDYQTFLNRPVEIGRAVAQSQTDEDHVFIVNLDLSKFYDCIDRPLLLQRLKSLAANYYGPVPDADFWSCVEKIMDWQWRKEDKSLASALKLSLRNGLPQGLVAAGFFANAYLNEFDTALGAQIGENLGHDSGLVLHDYCRYVDDLRLVVSLNDGYSEDGLEAKLNAWVQEMLASHGGPDLKVNEKKTQVTALVDLDNRGTLSQRIKTLQSDISGPSDRDALESIMGVLEGLLTQQGESIPATALEKDDHALLKLARFDHDIRPDTLKRFAANRLETIMRNKRKINEPAPKSSPDEENSLDNESELLSKKLILAWMQDPSLALVLRKALEIFPSPRHAEPVFEAIYRRTSLAGETSDRVTMAQFDYLLSDLFRSCVDFHGYFQQIEYPETSDPDALLSLATRYAQRVISTLKVPEFLERQALLLLAVMQRPVHMKRRRESIQQTLHRILAGAPEKLRRQHLALYEVAAQITGKTDDVASLLMEQLASADIDLKRRVLADFAIRGGEFWHCLWKRAKRKKGAYRNLLDEFRWAAPTSTALPELNAEQPLATLINSKDNGFVHEAALLKLAIALAKGLKTQTIWTGLSPVQINLRQIQSDKRKWSELWHPTVGIDCGVNSSRLEDPRYSTPIWIYDEEPDAPEIYWIGMILRAAAVGSNDFTSARLRKGTAVSYRGLRTGWYKRRMGMMHAPENLVGDYATLSDWISDLIRKCLQWPGYESTFIEESDIQAISDLSSFISVLENRLAYLNEMFLAASNTPSLVTHVTRRPDYANFRLVTVQQILPRASDFTKADPCLSTTDIKRRNRQHVAQLCQLTWKTLAAKVHADQSGERAFADLIVFPELAIHPDDMDLLKRLADKTRSMILAGLLFTDHHGSLVNKARWLIPNYRESGRQWITRDQGKLHPIPGETKLGIKGDRPCQHIIEVRGFAEGPFRLTAAVCYDATDLKLASDLKDKTELFLIVAHNKDVTTFDSMASALHYHMYQHVAVVNKGEFGGSTIQAPYKEPYDRLISHAHGTDQISINVADLDLAAFKRRSTKPRKKIKSKPAG